MDIHTLTDDELGQILWDFNVQLNAPQKADVILVLGSNDIRVAHKGVELFNEGYAPLLLFSGNVGRLTKNLWNTPEAVLFAEEAIKLGVPSDKMLIEPESTNTGENIDFSLKLLKEKNLNPQSFLIIQKPYMLQRALATFKKKLPNVQVSVACPDFSFQSYPNEFLKKDSILNLVVGDIQRLKLYSKNGFQVPVVIPENVWQAYNELVKRGYTQHLVD